MDPIVSGNDSPGQPDANDGLYEDAIDAAIKETVFESKLTDGCIRTHEATPFGITPKSLVWYRSS